MTEEERLKKFMLDNFDFDGLKQAGVFNKAIKRKDYQAQAERLCQWFGYQTIYEYRAPEITPLEGCNAAIAEFPGSVNQGGDYVLGSIAILDTIQSGFECPHCTCPNEVGHQKSPWQKCKGCKRKLYVVHDMTGDVHVFEK